MPDAGRSFGRRLACTSIALALWTCSACTLHLDKLERDAGPTHGAAADADGARADADGARADADGARADAAGVVPGTWVTISAGAFTMGSPTDEPCRGSRVQEEALHAVTLTHTFEIMTTEVTQADFRAVMKYNPSFFAACGEACPVERVSWSEAVAYLNALSARMSLPPCYSCTGSGSSTVCSETAPFTESQIYNCPGYRLPTEAEWEYAYRARTSTAFYSGPLIKSLCDTGTDPNADSVGWYLSNAGGSTHPVGEKRPNAWGLFDMSGNVWEWVHDWYQLLLAPATDPWGGTANEDGRIARGGAWDDVAHAMRAACRWQYQSPELAFNNIGFRAVRTK